MPRDIIRQPYLAIGPPDATGTPVSAPAAKKFVNLSSELTGIMMPQQTREERQTTAGGSSHQFVATRPKRMAGANFIQNFDDNKVYEVLQALFDGNNGSCKVLMRPSTDNVSATNPQAAFDAIILSLPTFEGALDDVPAIDLSLRISGNVTWTTS